MKVLTDEEITNYLRQKALECNKSSLVEISLIEQRKLSAQAQLKADLKVMIEFIEYHKSGFLQGVKHKCSSSDIPKDHWLIAIEDQELQFLKKELEAL